MSANTAVGTVRTYAHIDSKTPFTYATWMEAVRRAGLDTVAVCVGGAPITQELADEIGADGFATTLTVSPYQDGEAIRQEGEAAAAAHGVAYLHEDHRPRYQEAVRRSRELDMYRQNYCGCFLSEIEAEESRRRRREERA